MIKCESARGTVTRRRLGRSGLLRIAVRTRQVDGVRHRWMQVGPLGRRTPLDRSVRRQLRQCACGQQSSGRVGRRDRRKYRPPSTEITHCLGRDAESTRFGFQYHHEDVGAGEHFGESVERLVGEDRDVVRRCSSPKRRGCIGALAFGDHDDMPVKALDGRGELDE